MILASDNMSNICVQWVVFGFFNANDSTAWTDGDGKIIVSDEQQYGHHFYCPGIGI